MFQSIRITAFSILLASLARSQEPPTTAELTSARPVVAGRLAEWLWPATDRAISLTDALARTRQEPDRAVRYLLLGYLIDAAGRRGSLALGDQAIDSRREQFGEDPAELRFALLDAAATTRALPPLALAESYLALARSVLIEGVRESTSGPGLIPRPRLVQRAEAAARRAIRQASDRGFPTAAAGRAIEWRLAAIRAASEAAERLADREPATVARFEAGYFGDWSRADQLEEAVPAPPAVVDSKRSLHLGNHALRQAAHWRQQAAAPGLAPIVRFHFLQRSAHHYRIAHAHLGPLEQRRIERVLDRVHDTIGALDPLHHQLATESNALERWLVQGGAWSTDTGRILGRNTGPAARATLRVGYESIDEVLIDGGLTTRVGVNFRIAVGDLNLIFNWECADENHCYVGDHRTVTKPRLLVPGRSHRIRIRQLGDQAAITVDGEHVFRVPAKLRGTVTVYPAVGSELFVTRCSVVGTPDLSRTITGPDGKTR